MIKITKLSNMTSCKPSSFFGLK